MCGIKVKILYIPGPEVRATVPVTTKIPAPMEAPIPRRIRSNGPSRRVRPRLELSRAVFSAGVTTRLDRSADDQK